jgi:hypothetical protein
MLYAHMPGTDLVTSRRSASCLSMLAKSRLHDTLVRRLLLVGLGVKAFDMTLEGVVELLHTHHPGAVLGRIQERGPRFLGESGEHRRLVRTGIVQVDYDASSSRPLVLTQLHQHSVEEVLEEHRVAATFDHLESHQPVLGNGCRHRK